MNPTLIASLVAVALGVGCYGLYQRGEVLKATVTRVEGERDAARRANKTLTAQAKDKDRAIDDLTRENKRIKRVRGQHHATLQGVSDACLDTPMPAVIVDLLRSLSLPVGAGDRVDPGGVGP